MAVQTIRMSQVLVDSIPDYKNVKDRANQFFRYEFGSSFLNQLDMLALWPPESQNPPYFHRFTFPDNNAYPGELLWLVPLDSDAPLFEGLNIGVPYPHFQDGMDTSIKKPNKQIRYIGTLTSDGRLILLGWYNIKEGRYHIPYSKTLSIDFRGRYHDTGGKDGLFSGYWAYHPLPAEGLTSQVGTINYSLSEIEVILQSNLYS